MGAVGSSSFLHSAKEHAPLSAGANVDHGVDFITASEHENRAADRDCCVSTCCAYSFKFDSVHLDESFLPAAKYAICTTTNSMDQIRVPSAFAGS